MKTIVVFVLVALALVIVALPAAASGPQPPYIIIQHEVQPGETCPQLDSDYWLPNGTTCSINQRQDLLVGEYIQVPTRAGQRPAHSRLYYDMGPGLKPGKTYPPGYNANLWD